MNDHFIRARQDKPIRLEDHDLLERGPFVESLKNALVGDLRDTDGKLIGRKAAGQVVGLTGQWGLGKSSVLNLLYERLWRMDHVVVARFNPWLFNNRDELLGGFFNAMRTPMGKSKTEEIRELGELLGKYERAITLAGYGAAATIDAVGGSGLATRAFSWVKSKLSGKPIMPTRTPDEERAALEEKLEKANFAVVVIIDELDRVERKEVRAVAQLIKAVGEIKGLSYIVAYEPTRVINALGRGKSVEERRISGEAYLEKIVQHAIPLRPLFSEDVRSLLENAVSNHGLNLESPRTETQAQILEYFVERIETPREVKRLIGAFSVLLKAVEGEICEYDVLGYCWILTKHPTAREGMVSGLDRLVVDPGDPRAFARAFEEAASGNKQPDFNDRLGIDVNDLKPLLDLLFPHLSDRYETIEGNRLAMRRNLIRMLFLGNPPGVMPRSEIERYWGLTDMGALQEQLEALLETGGLSALLDPLDQLLKQLPKDGHDYFWPSLAAALRRKTDWIKKPEQSRALADDAATALYRYAKKERDGDSFLFRILETLVKSEDLVLAPWLLRKHLFAHGLTTVQQTPRGGGVLGREETLELLDRALPQYREAVLNGTALKRLPNVEAMFVLSNSSNWDVELRASLTQQLTTLSAISTFAALLVPPGHSADRQLLDTLFDAEAVTAKIEEFDQEGQTITDDWVDLAYRRLKAILRNQDPDFDDI